MPICSIILSAQQFIHQFKTSNGLSSTLIRRERGKGEGAQGWDRMKGRWSSPISIVLDQLKKIKESFFACGDSPRVPKIEPKERAHCWATRAECLYSLPTLNSLQIRQYFYLRATLAKWARSVRTGWSELPQSPSVLGEVGTLTHTHLDWQVFSACCFH